MMSGPFCTLAMFLSSCACAGVAEKGGGSIYSWYISIKEVGDTSDRGGGLWESEGGTYAILIVHNRLLSHRHLHHMGQNYPLSMDGATYHRHSGCQNFTTMSVATIASGQNIDCKDTQCSQMRGQ